MRRLLLIAGLLAALFAGTAASADTAKREGEYGGVVPGQKPETKPGKPKRPPAKGTLTWIGFEAKDGGAQLFFQSVSAFQISQKVVGSTLIATLDLTKLAANTWRRIDTRFFDNPLSNVVAKQVRRKKAIEVHITFKNPKDVREGTLRTTTEADGMYYAYLSFPEGTPAPSTTTTPKQEADE
jgi:hypothetical protein